MSYTLKSIPCNKNNYGGTRSTSSIKYIVIHFTANDGDKAVSNGNYFKNNVVKASAHYFVDDDTVVKSVDDNKVAWSVGGSKYADCKTTGGGTKYGTVTNSNSISIEMCDTKKDGKVMATKATQENCIKLAVKLMKKYNIPVSHVVRHFDVTGKKCPAYFVEKSKWETFKKTLKKEYENSTKNALKDTDTSKKTVNYTVKVIVDVLNIRKSASAASEKVGSLKKGQTAKIIQEVKNGVTTWGKIGTGKYICLTDYTKKM